jgi:hypothetical protein
MPSKVALADATPEEILGELERRIFCRGKKESRTILVGPPGCVIGLTSPKAAEEPARGCSRSRTV